MAFKRALVIGASGFIGGRLVAMLGPDRALGTWSSRSTEGLVRFDATRSRLGDLLRAAPGPFSHVIIPLAIANPDRCADDPVATAFINVDRIKLLMEDAWAASLVPIFLSTDYVFDGTRGLRTEKELQTPITEYGRQKATVERWLQGRTEPWLAARLSKVVSGDTDAQSVLGPWINDVLAGRSMRSATDQIFSPIWLDDLCRALIHLCETDCRGILNVAGPEAISRYDLNQMLLDAVASLGVSTEARLFPCSLAEIPFREPRPLNTSLSIEKLNALLPWKLCPMGDVVRNVASEHLSRGEAASSQVSNVFTPSRTVSG